jgi:predicted acylesterase/phospholipase RssA
LQTSGVGSSNSQIAAAKPEVRIGLALSGGGFRAAAFHLGVLKRLEELRVLHRVEVLSTVSGGSITGALYALRCSQRGGTAGAYPVEELIGEMRPFLGQNLRARALFGSPWRALRALVSTVSNRTSRIGLMVDELDRQLFHGATLDQMPAWIAINATNLRTGKGWRFFRDRAGDSLMGATEQTSHIRIAEAVAASAAYPGLTDTYAFRTTWEDLTENLISDERWARPRQSREGNPNSWRQRFGEKTGPLIVPLVDGGLYDNEGVISLRGAGVTHAIVSGVAPPASDSATSFTPLRYMRIVEVMHDRLGGATRQLAHEMTHGADPSYARKIAIEAAEALDRIAKDASVPAAVTSDLREIAARVNSISAVGMPPRGHQFTASAQILLHRTDLAKNAFRSVADNPVDVPEECLGLTADLVAELSRVRTDLDALEEEVIVLLMAQGYFLTDLYVKLSMPETTPHESMPAGGWYAEDLKPTWAFAVDAVAEAKTRSTEMKARLRDASSRKLLVGRVVDEGEHHVFVANAILAVAIGVVALGLAATVLWLGVRVFFRA